MKGTHELPPLPFDFTALSTTTAFVLESAWHPVACLSDLDLLLDLRAVMVGGGGVSVKPSIQFAGVRVDRPDEPALISTGSAATANGLTHYLHTLNAPTRTWFRRGIGYALTSGSFSRANGVLYGAYRERGALLAAEDIVFQPVNDTNAASIFPLNRGEPIPTSGLSVLRLSLMLLDNLNTAAEYRLVGRAFNDANARGVWTDLMSAWQATAAGDSEVAPFDVSLAGVSLTANQWFELGLAVRKATNGSTNSRCIFRVIPAVVLT